MKVLGVNFFLKHSVVVICVRASDVRAIRYNIIAWHIQFNVCFHYHLYCMCLSYALYICNAYDKHVQYKW